jgi:hypothetical protein
MRSKSTIAFNVVMALLFAYGTVDEFFSSPRTKYRLIAGLMMLAGFIVTSLIAWKDFRSKGRRPPAAVICQASFSDGILNISATRILRVVKP